MKAAGRAAAPAPPGRRKAQRGISAGLALAAIVLLGGMLAYAVTSTSGMHRGIAQELMQSRAQQAAEAGLEWARYQLRFNPAYCAAATTTQLSMPVGALSMPVTVGCSPSGPHDEAGTAVTTHQLTANACSPAGPGGACPDPVASADYVEHQASGIAER